MAKKNKIKSIGLVRGEEDSKKNSTLSFCFENNMSLYFLDRKTYRESKYDNKIINDLKDKEKNIYIIPEGGFNELGVKGCEEIMDEVHRHFDFISCSMGSGCTAIGLINSLRSNQSFLGFCSFKNSLFFNKHMESHVNLTPNWSINFDYNFGGFGKINLKLINFMKYFEQTYQIKLDPIYTSKLFFGLFDMISRKKFPKESRILVLHTGGLQGLNGCKN